MIPYRVRKCHFGHFTALKETHSYSSITELVVCLWNVWNLRKFRRDLTPQEISRLHIPLLSAHFKLKSSFRAQRAQNFKPEAYLNMLHCRNERYLLETAYMTCNINLTLYNIIQLITSS